MSDTFNAIVADEVDGKVKGTLTQLKLEDLPDEDVLVAVSYSTLNYKDGLAVSGKGKICRSTPMVCGIDLAGVVEDSKDERFKPGDKVLVNGFGLSEKYWGGYSQKQRLKGDWLVRVPDAFTLEEVMAIGTAGYTAMLCVQAIQDKGITAEDGPVIVSGASGGVGSTAILLLAKLGYQVTAITGRLGENENFLKSLGAVNVVERSAFDEQSRPLESETWAAGVDAAGGQVLATMLAQTKYEGLVAACGLAGGVGLPTTVMPFILRGVTLRGIDSVMAPLARRQRAWDSLAELVDRDLLQKIYTVKPMSDLPTLADQIIAGQITGRVVIDVNA